MILLTWDAWRTGFIRQGSAAIVRPASQDYRRIRRLIGMPLWRNRRRAQLKIEFRKKCWFDSGQGHHFIPIGEGP